MYNGSLKAPKKLNHHLQTKLKVQRFFGFREQ